MQLDAKQIVDTFDGPAVLIKPAADGMWSVISGQHRLQACMDAGRPCLGYDVERGTPVIIQPADATEIT